MKVLKERKVLIVASQLMHSYPLLLAVSSLSCLCIVRS